MRPVLGRIPLFFIGRKGLSRVFSSTAKAAPPFTSAVSGSALSALSDNITPFVPISSASVEKYLEVFSVSFIFAVLI